jgi:serine protease AprX
MIRAKAHETSRTLPILLVAIVTTLALTGGLLTPAAAAQQRTHNAFGASGTVDDTTTDSEPTWQSATATAGSGPLPDGFVDEAMRRIGAVDAWADGMRGQGALVAVIDTGVAPIAALEGSVVGEINFTDGDGGDGFGHGTYMASLIAAGSATAPGVAPEAGILSLKVADEEGSTDLRSVLDALQWLAGPGRSLGIRVATLAVGIDPDSQAGEVVDAATAALAAGGTLVITAAGNDEGAQRLTSPSTSPGTLSAGALDGDEPASFSATGPDRAGVTQPDAFLPGVGVYGHTDPDSAIAQEAAENAPPEAAERLALGQIRADGTSAAAALAAGVAALVSAENPALDGLELAAVLGKDSQGSVLDAPAAIAEAQALTTSRPDPELLPNGHARPVHPHTPPDEIPLAPVAEWTAAEWNTDGWRIGSWAGDRWQDDVWGVGRQAAKGGTAKWYTDEWHTTRWGAAKWYGDDWDTAKWYTAKWYTAKWYTAKWYGEDWDTAKWYTAKWYGDNGDTTAKGIVKGYKAKWYGDEWDSAKWYTAKWYGDGGDPAEHG